MFKTLFTTLRAKILAGYIAVILIMIAVMIWSLYNFNRLNESFREIIVQNYSSIVAADNMVRSLDSQVNGLFLFFSSENIQKGRNQFENSKQDFFYWYEKARQAAYTDTETAILDSINTRYASFLSDISILLNNKVIYRNNTERQKEYLNVVSLISEVKIGCYKIFSTNHNFIKQSEKSIQSITRIAAFTMLFLAILGTMISLIFSTKFSKYIVKPVKELTRSVKRISAGSFDLEINSEDSDEIGILTDEFNSMVGRLKRYEKLNINKILYEKRKSDTIIESINDPVLMVDGKLNILLTNKAFETEFGKVGNDETLLMDILSDKKTCNAIKTFITDGFEKNQDNVYRIINIDGAEKFFRLKFSPINLPENEVDAALIVFNDITKYEELDRMKSEFVAKVSHELKTPLTSMGMAIGILNDGVVSPLSEKQQELVSSMREDYYRLNRLVKEILELSRIESGAVILKLQRTDLNILLKNTVKAFTLQCSEKSIGLNYNPGNKLPVISADYDALSGAIGNFIGNAIKFTNRGGDININAEEAGASVIITIADTGSGIAPEYLDKIFDKFVQVSGSRPGSVGLGLTIAKEIIELHNGTINVFSKPGHGSKFVITIPVL